MNDSNRLSPFGAGESDYSNRVQLKVLGISYSQIQSGAYALILAEVNGPMRLPVVVGGMEAQSIAIRIEGIVPPRPMTHDLFVSLMHAYGLQLLEVFIYKFEDGIFSSELTFIDSAGKEVKLDARTSDAIAIAMRCNVPVYTNRSIIDETGFTMESSSGAEASAGDTQGSEDQEAPSPARRIAELREALKKAIDNEEYEEASRIKNEIAALEKEASDAE